VHHVDDCSARMCLMHILALCRRNCSRPMPSLTPGAKRWPAMPPAQRRLPHQPQRLQRCRRRGMMQRQRMHRLRRPRSGLAAWSLRCPRRTWRMCSCGAACMQPARQRTPALCRQVSCSVDVRSEFCCMDAPHEELDGRLDASGSRCICTDMVCHWGQSTKGALARRQEGGNHHCSPSTAPATFRQ
jgi:hypothetical protein